MNVNEEWFEDVLSVLRSRHQRNILLLLENKKAYSYTEMMNMAGYNSSNVFACHLRVLLNSKVLKREKNMYFLSRIGIETVKLLNQYRKICMSFDISDCDADGRIQMMVKR